jgi:DNA-binding transcriptional MerR regulator
MDAPQVTSDFSTDEAAKLARVHPQRLTDWDQSGFLKASVPAKRRGVSRRYTFRDVVAVRVVGELRKAGISLQVLRKIVAYLRSRDGLSATEVLARTNLVTDGDKVFEVSGDVTIHVPSGQRTMVHVTVPLDMVVSDLQRKARSLRRTAA